MWDFEHLSATPRGESQMVAFRDTLEICGLVDLGFVGVPFTYDNKRGGGGNVKVRLDRAVATNAWRNLFAYASVLHVPSPCSDDVAIVLKGSVDPGPDDGKQRRYELFWERDMSLPEVIKEAWEAVGVVHNMSQLGDALSKTMSDLRLWSKKFGNITRELAKSRTQLEELMNMNADLQDISRVTDKMNELLYQEEMLWLQ
ncbi:uncharacterized protein [Aegilops tauschii subsp. strangulata]|uniref:uncharacterized protein n=1 Tax=Aegilops tauschii subsp. strangulata TaxID=200361 RepID=UPI003CC870BC